MTKTYLLYRCGNDKTPVTIFTADSEEEAREAPAWLLRRHPESGLLHLGPGEFFEIIEQSKCSPEEWEEALARLKAGNAQGSWSWPAG